MSGYVVIGIPARNEAATVATVARVAVEGLRLLSVPGCVVLAENGSSDGTVEAFLSGTAEVPSAVLSAGGAGSGKGTNVFGLIDFALERNADRLVLLDADLRSADPSWVLRLARAVDRPRATMATPVYARDRYEAGTTNHLVTPLLAGLLGTRLQQPIGGEFAMNADFMKASLGWTRPGSSHLYGVDIWLTTNALMSGYEVREVELGRKLHRSPFVNILHLPQQVVDSLVHVVTERIGEGVDGSSAVEPAARASISDEPGTPQPTADVEAVLRRVRAYLRIHQQEILETFPTVRSVDRSGRVWVIPTTSWPEILAEGLTAMSHGSYSRARDHLIALYVMRLVTFWSETDQLSASAIQELLNEQVEATAKSCARATIDLSRIPARTSIPFDRGLWV